MDVKGNGHWQTLTEITLGPAAYNYYIFEDTLQAQWLRLLSSVDARLTATLHYSKKYYHQTPSNIFDALADADYKGKVVHAKLYPNHDNFNLSVHSGYVKRGHFVYQKTYEMDKYRFRYTAGLNDSNSLKALDNEIVWHEDQASVILQADTLRLRLPKGKGTYYPASFRNIRELESERIMANIHGTLYEVPLLEVGRNPNYLLMRPVATHHKMISDMATWNGLLVLSGVKIPCPCRQAEHIIGDKHEQIALWIGGIDDLWKSGKPVGVGGPWKNTKVKAGEKSDKYLMTGYDKKTLTLWADSDVTISILVYTTQYLPQAVEYKKIRIKANETIIHRFPDAYSAHWVQFMADKVCIVSGIFTYE